MAASTCKNSYNRRWRVSLAGFPVAQSLSFLLPGMLMGITSMSGFRVFTLLFLVFPVIAMLFLRARVGFVAILCFFASAHFTVFWEPIFLFSAKAFEDSDFSSTVFWAIFSVISQLPFALCVFVAHFLKEKLQTSHLSLGLYFGLFYIFVFSYMPTLFPLNPVVTLVASHHQIMHSLSIWGPEGVLFLTISMMCFLVYGFLPRGLGPKALSLVAAIACGITMLGVALIEEWVWSKDEELSEPMRVVAYQPGPVFEKLPRSAFQRFDREIDLLINFNKALLRKTSELNLRPKDIDLILFSETQFNTDLTDKRLLIPPLQKILMNFDAHLIAGGEAQMGEQRVNSAFLFDRHANLLGKYNKQKLIPIGEYRPFRQTLPVLSHLIPGKDKYQAGKASQRMVFNINSVSFGFLICYEDLFPQFFDKVVEQGGSLVISLSSDRLFNSYIMQDFHRFGSELQSLSFRRDLLRVTTDGQSAMRLASGQVIHVGRRGGPFLEFFEISVSKNLGRSIYSFIYWYLPFILCFGLALWIWRWDRYFMEKGS